MRCVLAHYSSNAVSAAPPGRAPWEADRGTHHPNYVAILLQPGNLAIWPCSRSLPRVPSSATATMRPPPDAPAPAASPTTTPKDPRLDAGNKHHDHCACPV
jgi:hypothetical protein